MENFCHDEFITYMERAYMDPVDDTNIANVDLSALHHEWFTPNRGWAFAEVVSANADSRWELPLFHSLE